MDIEYTQTDGRDMDLIAHLWEKQRDYHEDLPHHFPGRYSSRTFEWRKKTILEKAGADSIHIVLARGDAGDIIGYCIGSVSDNKWGEIDSIFVESEYRNSGVGGELMRKALHWMDEKQVRGKSLDVAAGNEGVFEFYRGFDFYPRTIILEQVKK